MENNNSMPSNFFTDNNLQFIFECWEVFQRNLQRSNLNEANLDVFAVYKAREDIGSNQLFEEKLQYYHAWLNTLRELYPDKSYLIDYTAGSKFSKDEICIKIDQFYFSIEDQSSNDRKNAIVSSFLQYLPKDDAEFILTIAEKPWINKDKANLLQEKYKKSKLGLINDKEELARLDKEIKEFECENTESFIQWNKQHGAFFLEIHNKSRLQEKSAKAGINFENSSEADAYDRRVRINKEVTQILSSQGFYNKINQIQENFTRSYLWEAFQENIIQEITNKKSSNTSNVLKLFDEMIIDFISLKPLGIWQSDPSQNFQHNYADTNIVKRILDRNKTYVDFIMNEFENILNNVESIFLNEKNPDSFDFFERRGTKNDNKNYIRSSLLINFQSKLLDNYIDIYKKKLKLSDEFYDPFDEYIKSHHGKEGLLEKSFILPQDLLIYKHLYQFSIIRKAYFGSDNRPLSGKALNIAMYEDALLFMKDKKFKKRLLPFVKINVAKETKNALHSFFNLVKTLIYSRQVDTASFKTVLCIGFVGPKFNMNEIELDNKKNIICLAFSASGNSEEYYFLLDLLRQKLSDYFEKDNINIEVLHPNGYELSKDLNHENNKYVHEYILSRIIEFVFLTHSDSINQYIKGTWQRLIINLIDDIQEKSKNKSLNNTNYHLLNDIKKNIEQLPLTTSSYQELRKIIIENQTFSCAEALVSRYGHTNLYVPISLRPKHEQQVVLDNKAVSFGTRPMIKPCYHCEMLSAAYMLWSEMTDKWHLDDMQKIAHKKGRELIPIRSFSLFKQSNITLLNTTPSFHPESEKDTRLKILENHQSNILKQISDFQNQKKSTCDLEKELQAIEQEIQELTIENNQDNREIKQTQLKF